MRISSLCRTCPGSDRDRRMPAAARLASRFPGRRPIRFLAIREVARSSPVRTRTEAMGGIVIALPEISRRVARDDDPGTPPSAIRISRGLRRSGHQPVAGRLPDLRRNAASDPGSAREVERACRARIRATLPDEMATPKRAPTGAATPTSGIMPLEASSAFEVRIPGRFRLYARCARSAGRANAAAGIVSRSDGAGLPRDSFMRRSVFAPNSVSSRRSLPHPEPRGMARSAGNSCGWIFFEQGRN